MACVINGRYKNIDTVNMPDNTVCQLYKTSLHRYTQYYIQSRLAKRVKKTVKKAASTKRKKQTHSFFFLHKSSILNATVIHSYTRAGV